jgi:hypothetical protein
MFALGSQKRVTVRQGRLYGESNKCCCDYIGCLLTTPTINNIHNRKCICWFLHTTRCVS